MMDPGRSPEPGRTDVRFSTVRHLGAVHAALFPDSCIACGAMGLPICDRCAQSPIPLHPPHITDPICSRCGRLQHRPDPLCPLCCRQGDQGVDRARAAALHEGLLRQGIHLLKYDNRTDLAPLLARYLVAAVQWTDWPVQVAQIDLVVPVPLHARRLAERGYNQAELLAETFCRMTGLCLGADVVMRVRHTESQVGKVATERRANVAEAFLAEPIAGMTCLLIDDVCTTGATLNATADALKAAGAPMVLGLTLAVPALQDTPDDHEA